MQREQRQKERQREERKDFGRKGGESRGQGEGRRPDGRSRGGRSDSRRDRRGAGPSEPAPAAGDASTEIATGSHTDTGFGVPADAAPAEEFDTGFKAPAEADTSFGRVVQESSTSVPPPEKSRWVSGWGCFPWQGLLASFVFMK